MLNVSFAALMSHINPVETGSFLLIWVILRSCAHIFALSRACGVGVQMKQRMGKKNLAVAFYIRI